MGFQTLFFSAVWKFIENSSFDQKQKFFRHFAQHDTMIHLGKKIFRGYGHFQDSFFFFLTSNYSISHNWIASLAQFVPINDIFSLKAENRGGKKWSLSFRKQFGRKKRVKEISEQGDIDLVYLAYQTLGSLKSTTRLQRQRHKICILNWQKQKFCTPFTCLF